MTYLLESSEIRKMVHMQKQYRALILNIRWKWKEKSHSVLYED